MKIKATKIEDIKDAKYGDVIFFSPVSSITSKLQVKIDNIGVKHKKNVSHVAIFHGYIDGKPHMREATNVNQTHKQVGLSPILEYRNFEILRPHNTAWLKSRTEIMSISGISRYQFSRLWTIAKARIFGTSLEADDVSSVICSEDVNWCWNYYLCDKANCTPVTMRNNFQIVNGN
jgi:hypothetical protein